MSELATQPLGEQQAVIRRFAETNDPGIRREILSPLIAPNNRGFFTSLGPLFRDAVFGRDSIKMAEDMHGTLHERTKPAERAEVERLSRNVILTLAGLQGVKSDSQFSEEQPGKIHHEYRNRSIEGRQSDEVVQHIITKLQEEQHWMPPGSDENELCYYGSADSTPLYIRLVKDHVDLFGNSILHEQVEGRDGVQKNIANSIARAAEYLHDEVGRSVSGLLEFKRTNPTGLRSQSWKDSPNAYLHLDGTQANYDGGVAAIDVQGYAYDALVAAAELLPYLDQAEDWRERAGDLKARTLEKLWLPDAQYFAQALDYDDSGQPRLIKTLASDAAVTLATGLLEDDRERRMHIIERMQSAEFHTPAGPRLRSLGHIAIEGGVNYHGSLVVWPKEVSDYVKGLERGGSDLLAVVNGNGIITSSINTGDFREYLVVDKRGRVHYKYGSDGDSEHNFEGSGEAGDPQSWQGWTVTAFLRAVSKKHAVLNNA